MAGGAAAGAESGRVELSAAVLMRRRAAAVVAAAAACRARRRHRGARLPLGEELERLHGCTASPCAAAPRANGVAVRDAVARAAAGARCSRSRRHAWPARSSRCRRSASPASIATSRTRCASTSSRSAPSRLRWAAGDYRSLVAASGRVLRVFGPHEAVPVLPRVWTQRERPVAGGSMRTVRCAGRPRCALGASARFRRAVANVKMEPERGIVMRLQRRPRHRARPAAAAARQAARRRLGSASLSDDARTATQLVYADVSAPDRPAVMPRGGYAADRRVWASSMRQARQRRANRSECRVMRATGDEAFLYREQRTRRPRRGVAV